jgi:hypothetical protein
MQLVKPRPYLRLPVPKALVCDCLCAWFDFCGVCGGQHNRVSGTHETSCAEIFYGCEHPKNYGRKSESIKTAQTFELLAEGITV